MKASAFDRLTERQINASLKQPHTPSKPIAVDKLSVMQALLLYDPAVVRSSSSMPITFTLNESEYPDLRELIVFNGKYFILFIGCKYKNGLPKFNLNVHDGITIEPTWFVQTLGEGEALWVPQDDARKKWLKEYLKDEKAEYFVLQPDTSKHK